MADAWCPGAIHYPVNSPGSYAGGPKRFVLHTTENTPESTTAMNVCEWMKRESSGSVYHIIYHPISGETVQMLPVTGSAKSLSNPSGGVETNRGGSVVIQVSVVARAADPFTKYAMPGWGTILSWADSWGIPRQWVANPPNNTIDHVSNSHWNATSGWYGHANVPENSHHDPGSLDLNKLFEGVYTAPTPPAPSVPVSGSYPLPADHWYGTPSSDSRNHSGNCPGEPASVHGWGGSGGVPQCQIDNGNVAKIQQHVGASADGYYGPNTESAVRNWQSSVGLAADGAFGGQSWTKAFG